jgi:Mlc titration factor MtfA (ptsG expression regulator)
VNREIHDAFGWYRALDTERRERCDAQIARFLATKRFRSDGDPVDERTKLFIAALACRMTIEMPLEEYRRLELVNVVDELLSKTGAPLAGHMMDQIVPEVTFTRAALVRAFVDDDDGHNVVYHELAHVLDAADGISDGVPPLLLHPEHHDLWRRVMARELDRLRAAVALGIPTALDRYGTKSEVELFAVATEAFFERPDKVRNAHPELFALLREFFGSG